MIPKEHLKIIAEALLYTNLNLVDGIIIAGFNPADIDLLALRPELQSAGVVQCKECRDWNGLNGRTQGGPYGLICNVCLWESEVGKSDCDAVERYVA